MKRNSPASEQLLNRVMNDNGLNAVRNTFPTAEEIRAYAQDRPVSLDAWREHVEAKFPGVVERLAEGIYRAAPAGSASLEDCREYADKVLCVRVVEGWQREQEVLAEAAKVWGSAGIQVDWRSVTSEQDTREGIDAFLLRNGARVAALQVKPPSFVAGADRSYVAGHVGKLGSQMEAQAGKGLPLLLLVKNGSALQVAVGNKREPGLRFVDAELLNQAWGKPSALVKSARQAAEVLTRTPAAVREAFLEAKHAARSGMETAFRAMQPQAELVAER